jgi:hypothetical protein
MEQEIAQLRAEVDALKSGLAVATVQTQATMQMVMALAATHPNPQAALEFFNLVGAAADGPWQYSKATDEQLALLETQRAIFANILRTAQP